MNKYIIYITGFLFLSALACNRNGDESKVEIPDFTFAKTIVFEDSLSAYEIFKGHSADLIPNDDFELLELNSILFTDYAHKQRLVKIPESGQLEWKNDGTLLFPDGTILTKTFFYYKDERNYSLGKRIIETRLLIKENDFWNIASYIWNEEQSEAILELNGKDIEVSWINLDGSTNSTLYDIPDENECIACHQSNSNMIPLGTNLRNLNRLVERVDVSINQLEYLQSINFLNNFQLDNVPDIVDYNNDTYSLELRARAYLDLNCAHCHNPSGWDESSERDFDFRYETALHETGMIFESERIIEALTQGEMPFIGTTVLDEEGIDLIINFMESF